MLTNEFRERLSGLTAKHGGRVGFGTALTSLTVLTVLTADVVDEVDPVGWLTKLTLAVNEVNVVRTPAARASVRLWRTIV